MHGQPWHMAWHGMASKQEVGAFLNVAAIDATNGACTHACGPPSPRAHLAAAAMEGGSWPVAMAMSASVSACRSLRAATYRKAAMLSAGPEGPR